MLLPKKTKSIACLILLLSTKLTRKYSNYSKGADRSIASLYINIGKEREGDHFIQQKRIQMIAPPPPTLLPNATNTRPSISIYADVSSSDNLAPDACHHLHWP